MESSRFKILCLHGCRQNKETFRQKLGSFRKPLDKIAEFFFVDAPHSIPSVDGDKEQKSWWFTGCDQTYVSKVPSDIDEGFEESIQCVEDYIAEKGPFDGLMGFSQGATLAAIICSLIEKDFFKAEFKFVILVAGFKSLCTPHKKFYLDPIKIPSLHVIGDGDAVISKERSDDLLTVFENSHVLRHPGGHYVPAAKEFRQRYLDFLKNFIPS